LDCWPNEEGVDAGIANHLTVEETSHCYIESNLTTA
jgi:hypothetical protein